MRANKEQQEAYINMLRSDYLSYCLHVNNGGVIDSRIRWVPARMHKYLCNEINAFLREDKEESYDVLCISTPPQHGKSKCITEVLPSYYINCIDENGQVLIVSYGDGLARRFGRTNREHIKNHGNLFGHEIDSQLKGQLDFKLKGKDGRIISRGVGSSITGEKANLVIIDDPIKNREQADSKKEREKLVEEWKNTISSRIAPNGKVVLIMTRWHEDDLFSTISNEKGAKVINLPCESEGRGDPLGRRVGEPLCPEIGKGKAWLKSYKNKLITGAERIEGESGKRAWNALFQGRPTQKEGNLFKRDCWQFYESGTVQFEHVIMAVDCTFKGLETSDYVAIGVFGKRGTNIYLIDMINKHMGFVETLEKVTQVKSMYMQTSAILIEDKANGSAIIEVLRRKIAGIIGVEPRGGKVARANSIADLQEAKNIYLPRNHPVVGDFIDQCSEFPSGKNDDMVDVLSMGVERLRYMNVEQEKVMFDRKGIIGSGERYYVI